MEGVPFNRTSLELKRYNPCPDAPEKTSLLIEPVWN